MTPRNGLRTRHPWLVLGVELVVASVLLTALFVMLFTACLEGAAG